MAAAPPDAVPLVDELLARSRAIAADETRIEELKELLRAIADRAGRFEHAVGRDTVTVGKSRASKFTGQVPQLVPELFLAMTDAERKQLLDDGLVVITSLYSKAGRGAVTVSLA